MKFYKIVKIVYWLSPILKLFSNTVDAVYDGYNERYIKDPGHNVIKIFDKIIITLSWLVAISLLYPSMVHYQDIYFNDQLVGFLMIFFPYFANIYIAIFLYVNSIILSIYNKNRKNIIRKINEKRGVW